MADNLKKSSRGKRPYVDFNCSFGLKNVIVSLCNKTADERHAELKEAIEQSYDCNRERLIALYSLLDELVAVNCISFQEAFDQFAGKVPSIACKPDKKEARRQFTGTIEGSYTQMGDEGTGYLEHEQRIQSKEMLRIANR